MYVCKYLCNLVYTDTLAKLFFLFVGLVLLLNNFNALKYKYIKGGLRSPCYYYILSFGGKGILSKDLEYFKYLYLQKQESHSARTKELLDFLEGY